MSMFPQVLPFSRLLAACVLAFWTVALPSVVLAQEEKTALKLEDFAEAITLTPQSPGPIHRLILPEAVYRGSVSTGFSDVRVFNHDGLPVPHAIRRLGVSSKHSKREESLRFFPLYVKDAEGSSIGVPVAASKEPAPDAQSEKVIAAYLVDLSKALAPITALTITFKSSPDSLADYVLPLRVETSSDLTHFSFVGGEQTLLRLDYEGESIERSRFELDDAVLPASGNRGPSGQVRYLRLTWTGALPAPIESVRAELGVSVSVEHWETKLLEGQAGGSAETYLYDLGGSVPIDQVLVKLGEDNLLIQAQLESADNKAGPFQLLERGTYYRVKHEEIVLESPAQQIPRRRAKFLRLSPMRPGSSFGPHAPHIQIAHYADQLLFTHRGVGPFHLAFGHYAALDSALSVGELLAPLPSQAREALTDSDTELSDTKLGEVRVLAGPSARVPLPPGTPWKKYVLWSVLVGAVIILGFAAFSLLRSQHK